jgi:hypothetical protein
MNQHEEIIETSLKREIAQENIASNQTTDRQLSEMQRIFTE